MSKPINNTQKKEELISALLLTTNILVAYVIRLMDSLEVNEGNFPEFQKLLKHIESISYRTGIKRMSKKEQLQILKDNDSFIKLIDKFMGL